MAHKQIIYLDQNFISNMAIAKTMGRGERHFSELFDRLEALVRADKVVCPESVFHEIESKESSELTLMPAIQEIVTKLSWGLQLRDWHTIILFQVHWAMNAFLHCSPSGPAIDPSDAFDRDPHEPVENRAIHLGDGRALTVVSWAQNGTAHSPAKYIGNRHSLKGTLTWGDLRAQIKREKEGLIEYLYGTPSNALSRLEAWDRMDEFPNTLADLENTLAAGLQNFANPESRRLRHLAESWDELGAPRDKLPGFLTSQHIHACPFIDIAATLGAALVCDPNRKPKNGDAADNIIIATVLPYCYVLATDAAMADLLRQTGLENKYGKRVYSAKEDAVKLFLKWLQDL
jgi:hypothetical protein